MNAILALETSCDETAAAVIIDGQVQSNIIATQEIHKEYGGVVPELASRMHQQHIIPVIQEALYVANVSKSTIQAIAFTQGPGLLGALLIGNNFARSFAMAQGIPLIAVHHMQAHILANFIEAPKPSFPFLCLTVSGGHTQLVLVEDYLHMQCIGQTQDDAVGEAFDKIARMMGFSYPGGALIDQYAQKGDAKKFFFPMTNMSGLDFSFSGIKSSFMYFIKKNKKKDPLFIKKNLHDLCASIQITLVNMLLQKLYKAVKHTGIHTIALAGGVAANTVLRKTLLQQACKENWRIFIPELAYCTDNAAMIAQTAYYKYNAKDFCNLYTTPNPRMPM